MSISTRGHCERSRRAVVSANDTRTSCECGESGKAKCEASIKLNNNKLTNFFHRHKR